MYALKNTKTDELLRYSVEVDPDYELDYTASFDPQYPVWVANDMLTVEKLLDVNRSVDGTTLDSMFGMTTIADDLEVVRLMEDDGAAAYNFEVLQKVLGFLIEKDILRSEDINDGDDTSNAAADTYINAISRLLPN